MQCELAGYEFVQWPIAGQRLLTARIVDDHAVWVEPSADTVTALIGELCSSRPLGEEVFRHDEVPDKI